MAWRLRLLSSLVCVSCVARRISISPELRVIRSNAEEGHREPHAAHEVERAAADTYRGKRRFRGTVFGTDLGGVLSQYVTDVDDDSNETWLQRGTITKGALDAVRLIVDSVGSENSYVIATAGADADVEAKKAEWLETIGFYEYTGMPRENVHWVREDEDKGLLARELNITHFVDDRPDCLMYVYSKGLDAFRNGHGQLVHFKRSGMGVDDASNPGPPVWPEEIQRPPCVVAAAEWRDVLTGLNFGPWSNWTEAMLKVELHKYDLWELTSLEPLNDTEPSKD